MKMHVSTTKNEMGKTIYETEYLFLGAKIS